MNHTDALAWYDKHLAEDTLTRDEFHMFVLELLETKVDSEPPRFPTMLRKMWSGREVQEWVNEHWHWSEPALRHAKTQSEHDALAMMKLIKDLRYISGIAERGRGRPIEDGERVTEFVLEYVKSIEAEVERLRQDHAAYVKGNEVGQALMVERLAAERKKVAEYEAVMRVALAFVSSESWGTSAYMDSTVYSDAAALRTELQGALHDTD